MKDIGDYLKEVRLARGFTQSDIEIATRIPAKYLDAIEKGDFNRIPGNAYVIGFIRSYAKFLQVDSDELVNYYKESVGLAEENSVPMVGHVSGADKEALAKANYRPLKKWQTGIMVSLLLIVAASGILYYLGTRDSDGLLPDDQSTNQGQTGQNGDNGQVPVIPGDDSDDTSQNPVEEPTDSGNDQDDINTVETAGLTIKIIAKNAPCWIGVTKTSGYEQHMLNRGDEITLTDDTYMKIKYGSAGAVDVYVNDVLQSSLGDVSAVITKEYQK